MIRTHALALTLVLPCQGQAADFWWVPEEAALHIEGEIVPEDADKFLSVLLEIDGAPNLIHLNSPGGDVGAAMEIGRGIRAAGLHTMIFIGDECSSSCALIFVGGVRGFFRSKFDLDAYSVGQTRLGLHRPYLVQGPGAPPPDQEVVRSIYSSVEQYLYEMNITSSFFEIMMNTPPGEVKYFTGDEVYDLVPEDDPYYDEVSTSWRARYYGLDTSTLRERDHLADVVVRQQCFGANYYEGCSHLHTEATLWNVSINRIEEFDETRERDCSFSSEEWDILRAYLMTSYRRALVTGVSDQWRWRKDHPLVIDQERCHQELMFQW